MDSNKEEVWTVEYLETHTMTIRGRFGSHDKAGRAAKVHLDRAARRATLVSVAPTFPLPAPSPEAA